MAKRVLVSGGFDPPHIGHVKLFEEARALGDSLIVVLNSDEWLIRKKGKYFMQEDERAYIIKTFKPVDAVYILHSDKDDVSEALRELQPDIFANGGDRKQENTPETEVCKELGIEMVFNVGGEKIQSSSELLKKYGH